MNDEPITDGEVLERVWQMLTNDNATTQQLIEYLKSEGCE
jgi:hypothetical protein